jgi:hypothetical protein
MYLIVFRIYNKLKQAHLQFAQANAQSKNCKRVCFTNADKNCLKKTPQRFKKIKIQRHTDIQTQQTMT